MKIKWISKNQTDNIRTRVIFFTEISVSFTVWFLINMFGGKVKHRRKCASGEEFFVLVLLACSWWFCIVSLIQNLTQFVFFKKPSFFLCLCSLLVLSFLQEEWFWNFSFSFFLSVFDFVEVEFVLTFFVCLFVLCRGEALEVHSGFCIFRPVVLL